MKNKVGVFKTLIGVGWLLNTRFNTYFVEILIPFSLILVIEIISSTLESNIVTQTIFSLLDYAITALIAYSFHRVSVIGAEEPRNLYSSVIINKEKALFFIKVIALAIIGLLPLLVIGRLVQYFPEGVNGLTKLSLLAIGMYFSSRFSLVLPSHAVGSKLSYMESWALTKKNGLKITFMVYLLPLTVFWFISKTSSDSNFTWLITSILSVLFFVLPFIVLSLVYIELVNNERNTNIG